MNKDCLDKDPSVVYHNAQKADKEVRREFKHRCQDGETRVIHACYIRVLMSYHNTGMMRIAKRAWVRIGSWCPSCGFIPGKVGKPHTDLGSAIRCQK